MFWRIQALLFEVRVRSDSCDHALRDRQLLDRFQTHRFCSQAVLEIVGLLRNFVGHRHRLALEVARFVEKKAVTVGHRKRVIHLPESCV